jgi:hypothetical protein
MIRKLTKSYLFIRVDKKSYALIGRTLSAIFFASFVFPFFPNSYGQIAQTGAIDNNQVSVDMKLTVWAVPAEQKVRPDDRLETDNLVWTKEEKNIKVAGAGNEHIPFQVVISATIPEKKGPAADGFFIEASSLSAGQGKVIAKDQIKFYLQHYILLDAKSSPVGATGYWPDALAPIREPFSMSAQYSVVKNRPIWVDLTIPSGTPAGIYKGTITVTQHGKLVDKLNVEVEIYGFSLPDETPLITYMNVSKGWLAGFYNKPVESPEIERLTKTYYDFLYQNRMEPWFNDMLLPEIAASGKGVKVKFDDSKYNYYMNELKTKRVLLNAFPGSLKKHVTEEPFSKAFNEKVQSYLSQVEKYFSKNGWKDRLVFNSPIDEPRTMEDYEDTRRWAHLVHAAAGDVAFLSTRTPVPVKEHPEWGTLRGHVNNFSIHGNHMNDPEVKRVINEEQAKGGEMTWYISCDQRYPQPNYFIDAPALDLVMVPWITERYGMDGILYWAVNFWSQTPNPWLDASTFHSGFLCSGGWVLNGEGSLVYPGDHTKRYTGQPDVDGPVSSIRFELLREGIEDHTVLSMLKNSGNEAFGQKQVRDLVIDVSAFSRNLKELYLAREAMARRLEGSNP